jgi:hypothetical protein
MSPFARGHSWGQTMAQGDTKNSTSFAREKAREIVQRQRESQEALARIEALKSVATPRFKRLNSAITMSFVWLVLIAMLGGAIAWYWADIITVLSGLLSPS